MTDKNLGHATAYGYAKSKGYTGTEEEFAELMASYAEVATDARGYAEQAEQSASNAQTSATNASASATTAGTKASEASASAQTATTKASEASASATSASESASTAVSAKDDAVTAKESAETAKADAETAAEEAQESAQTVANKADKDGTYPDMTVGGVMSSDGSTDSTPYLYRASGGGVEVGKIEADKIVGGTVAFNQQIRNGNFTNGDAWQKTSGIALSVSSNIGTLTTSEDGDKFVVDTFTDRVPIGHKVLYWVEAKTNAIPSGDSFNVMAVFFFGLSSTYKEMRAIDDNWHTYSGVVDIGAPIGQNARYVMMRLCCRKTVITNQYKNVQVYDLTAMFGSAVADMIYNMETANTGSGVAFFRKLFPKDYYEYNTGELMHVSGVSEHVMRGKNLNPNEGVNYTIKDSQRFFMKAGNYVFSTDNGAVIAGANAVYIQLQNEDGTVITKGGITSTNMQLNGTETCYFGGQFNSECAFTLNYDAYMLIGFNNQKPTNFNALQIELGARATAYEPYREPYHYPLDSSLTLRGIPKVADGKMYFDGDTYEADGTVTRKYGVVIFDGTDESLALQSINSYGIANFGISLTPYGTASARKNGICDRFVSQQSSISSTTSEGFMIANEKVLYIRISASKASTIDELNAWLASNPVTVVYELATPTTESAEPYESIQKVSKYGTEEYVSTGIVPVGHVTKYPTDIVAKVNGLPSDFSTLIAPTETGFKATRAYSVNQFIIVNNQLYRVTSAIASGATITVGTNVTATTVADILTALLNA